MSTVWNFVIQRENSNRPKHITGIIMIYRHIFLIIESFKLLLQLWVMALICA